MLKPLFAEVGLLYIIMATYWALLADELKVRIWGDSVYATDQTFSNLLQAVSQVAFLPLFHRLRQLLHEKQQRVHQMQSFELAKVDCTVPSDREFIYMSILDWYGSEEGFEQYVRGPLADELVRPFTQIDFPAVYWLMTLTPVIGMGLDFWLNEILRRSNPDPLQAFLAWVIATPLTFMNVLHLCYYLCDCLRPGPGILDFVKSLLVWLVLLFGTSMMFQQHGLLGFGVHVTLAACAAHVAINFLLRWAMRSRKCSK